MHKWSLILEKPFFLLDVIIMSRTRQNRIHAEESGPGGTTAGVNDAKILNLIAYLSKSKYVCAALSVALDRYYTDIN